MSYSVLKKFKKFYSLLFVFCAVSTFLPQLKASFFFDDDTPEQAEPGVQKVAAQHVSTRTTTDVSINNAHPAVSEKACTKLGCSRSATDDTAVQTSYPDHKVTIVGGGIAGALHVYHAHRTAQKLGKRVRVSLFEKNKSLADTTTMHIVPSLTPDEILSVVPRGKVLVEKLQIVFNQPGGIRVDDVHNVNDSATAKHFIDQASIYSQDEAGHKARTQSLLALGKMSMDMWQDIFDTADQELKSILLASNFNPCREPRNMGDPALHDGYRIDLIYNVAHAAERAEGMRKDYEGLGYKNCKLLSPEEVIARDPFLKDFCTAHSTVNQAGTMQWNNDSVALWRPGGCIDTNAFLPKFYAYLTKIMGSYTNQKGIVKNCFQMKFAKCVNGLELQQGNDTCTITGLRFAEGSVKKNKHAYAQSQYVFCPGEAVGTLHRIGLKEAAYAGFAGASLMLNIAIPADKVEEYSKFNHCMEVHQEGVVLAWQARFREGKIFIGVAGTKAFYADQTPDKDQAFAKDRNLLQLNMVNDVLPEFISLALGRDTKGQRLDQDDMDELESKNIAQRWVGTRAVVYDGFPTLGAAVTHDGKMVSNAIITTHLGSGGGSFGPAAVAVSYGLENVALTRTSELESIIMFAQSNRVA